MTADIKTYSPGELLATIINEDNSTTNVDVVFKISTFDVARALHFVMLGNTKCYLTQNLNNIYYYEEILPHKLFDLLHTVNIMKSEIGNVGNLLTNNKSLVSAINELSSVTSTTRKLKGYIQWLVFDKQTLDNIDASDLDITYCVGTDEWLYYSKNLLNWLPLPEGWQQLKHIVRTFSDRQLLMQTTPNQIAGVLENSYVYKDDGTNIWKIDLLKDQVGDEYIVQYIVTDTENIKNGTLINTPKGWVYLIN